MISTSLLKMIEDIDRALKEIVSSDLKQEIKDRLSTSLAFNRLLITELITVLGESAGDLLTEDQSVFVIGSAQMFGDVLVEHKKGAIPTDQATELSGLVGLAAARAARDSELNL